MEWTSDHTALLWFVAGLWFILGYVVGRHDGNRKQDS